MSKWIALAGYLFGSLALIFASAWLLSWQMRWSLVLAYLVSINGVTSLVYLLDKITSKIAVLGGLMRVPELVLHLLALLGGTPGALAVMLLAQHKVNKNFFLLVHFTIWISQIALAIAYRGIYW